MLKLKNGRGALLKVMDISFHAILFKAVKEQVSSQGGNLLKHSCKSQSSKVMFLQPIAIEMLGGS